VPRDAGIPEFGNFERNEWLRVLDRYLRDPFDVYESLIGTTRVRRCDWLVPVPAGGTGRSESVATVANTANSSGDGELHGMVLFMDDADNHGLFILGPSLVRLIHGSGFEASSTPASGNSGVYYTSGEHRIKNNTGATRTYRKLLHARY
jgi:hypothetical protein